MIESLAIAAVISCQGMLSTNTLNLMAVRMWLRTIANQEEDNNWV
ncbi:MAG: hypothetical protein SVY53_06365 [Chloroflexota bacterium]|nr:hypothetical protein [Chloroflexota bacterium]